VSHKAEPLRTLAEKASRGPWEFEGLTGDGWALIFADTPEDRPDWNGTGYTDGIVYLREDAAYIAAASPDVILRLLDERDAAIRRAEEAEALVQRLAVAVERRRIELTDPAPTTDWPAFADESLALAAARTLDRASQESQKPPETITESGLYHLKDGEVVKLTDDPNADSYVEPPETENR